MNTKPCCEVFKKLIPSFQWMVLEKKTLLMPHIKVGDDRYRINYCLSCGAEVRDIQIPNLCTSPEKQETK